MIERLQRALEHLGELPPEVQAELAEIIEEQTEPLGDLPQVGGPSDAGAELPQAPEEDGQHAPRPIPDSLLRGLAGLPPALRARRLHALALAGAWSDLQGDDEFAFFDRIRHESPPSPPVEEQLAWLDEEEGHPTEEHAPDEQP